MNPLNILAETTHDLRQRQRRTILQRRNQVVDLYGIEYARDTNENGEAIFGIPLSQDYIYIDRFEFKIIISPKLSSSEISTQTSYSEFQVLIEGVDITPYFKAQFNGVWINGYGTFPNNGTANFDVAGAVGYMKEEEREKILRAGYNTVQVNCPFQCHVVIQNYPKYSHTLR